MSNFNEFLSSLNKEQKQKLVEALMGSMNDNSQEQEAKTETTEQPNRPVIDENFKVTRSNLPESNRRREPVKARRNEYVDTGEHKDVETPYGERTPRRRPPPKKVDIECHVCGKSYKMDPRFVYGEYYRCNRCTGR